MLLLPIDWLPSPLPPRRLSPPLPIDWLPSPLPPRRLSPPPQGQLRPLFALMATITFSTAISAVVPFACSSCISSVHNATVSSPQYRQPCPLLRLTPNYHGGGHPCCVTVIVTFFVHTVAALISFHHGNNNCISVSSERLQKKSYQVADTFISHLD